MNMKSYVAYYRVSTRNQNLGLEAQQTVVSNFVSNNGGNVIAEFQEKESGKNDLRIELNKAVNYCTANNATLIIAKLDRLSRNVEFIFKLKNSNIDFLACDLPEFNTLTLAIFSAMAQQERELISCRTKAALTELKKTKKLGKPENLTDNMNKAIENSRNTRKQKAINNDNNLKAYSMIELLLQQNMNLSNMAKYLNKHNFMTSTNKQHTAMSIKLLIKMYQQ